MSLPELIIRPRRLRTTPTMRRMVRETTLSAADLIYPLFVDETIDAPIAVASMPGVSRIPLSQVGDAVREVEALGISGIILFGIPAVKDAVGSGGWDENGIVQQAIRAAKAACPDISVTDRKSVV